MVRALMDRFYEAGRYGQKTSKGFYRYEPGSRVPLPDPESDAIIEAYRKEVNAKPGVVTDEEIVKRMIYALANEGANILEEGIAYRSGDIDITYLYGYGFPAWRGGPMKYAELQGLSQVLADIESLPEALWRPLETCAIAEKPRRRRQNQVAEIAGEKRGRLTDATF